MNKLSVIRGVKSEDPTGNLMTVVDNIVSVLKFTNRVKRKRSHQNSFMKGNEGGDGCVTTFTGGAFHGVHEYQIVM